MSAQTDSTSVTMGISHPGALKFIVLLGVVSLLADMTYEGARSVTGPYLALLGASGLVVGIIAGLGELMGYALRLGSGYLADRTGRYWAITILGYLLNLFAVPLLALAGNWELAAALMIAERVGKAIRTPARDAMLSHATKQVGHGWGFGLHEALDQAGAVLGPLVVAAVLSSGAGYRAGFGTLLVPALLALAVLMAAQRQYPHPRDLELETEETLADGRSFPRAFWIYLAAAAAIAAGYADFPLIAYHFSKANIISAAWIPVLYAVAMGVDALAALAFGRLFDRLGLMVLVASTLLSAPFALLVFRGGFGSALLGTALWGIGMGAQESILRAAIARMVHADRRGSAYGLFNAAYGAAWFLGSALMGYLYDVSIGGLIAFSIGAQLVAIPLFLGVAEPLHLRHRSRRGSSL
ncbi:MAG: MFS transporter [Isosphaeraceae bacterium]|nr:MFS transporter [Isosphaeraceae bacterium]